MNRVRLVLFAALAAVQLAVPGWAIVRQQTTLAHGRVFRFRTAPVDPHDAFRGRYVALRFEASDVPVKAAVRPGQRVWLVLAEDAGGFAKVENITADRVRGDNVMAAKAGWPRPNWTRVEFPFDRYYMEESAAPKAEAYYQASRRGAKPAWVTVRVRDGHAALEELFIDGLPIREFLRTR